MSRARAATALGLLAAALITAAVGFRAELERARERGAKARQPGAAPRQWRLVSPEVRQLDRFLARAGRRLGAGAQVAVVCTLADRRECPYVGHWAVFLHPELPLVGVPSAARLPRATHLVAYGPRQPPPGARSLLRRGALELFVLP